MNTPERTSRDETDVSPTEDLGAALAEFMDGFKSQQSEMTKRFQQQEERLTMYERKSLTSRARPALSSAVQETAPHLKAFGTYLRSGDEDALRGIDMEGKAMSTAVAADGGYLVDPQTSESVQTALKNAASLRAIASVVNVESTSYDVLVDHTDAGAGWASESSNSPETSTPSVDFPRSPSACWTMRRLTSRAGLPPKLPTNSPAPKLDPLSAATELINPRAF
jgi:HK97 family phage major capsid protein